MIENSVSNSVFPNMIIVNDINTYRRSHNSFIHFKVREHKTLKYIWVSTELTDNVQGLDISNANYKMQTREK